MTNRLNEILAEIRKLEKSIEAEIKCKEEEFQYTIRKRKVVFQKEVLRIQKTFRERLYRYVLNARILNALTMPVIYPMILPALLMDLAISIYQFICFPIYRIPRVRRRDHIILDRHYLKYLNLLERLNCDYCSYFNGLASYISEIGARTEQYWCPIKHASGKVRPHSRYEHFFDYGDAEAYRVQLEEIQKRFADLEEKVAALPVPSNRA